MRAAHMSSPLPDRLAGGARFDASPGIWNHVRMTTLFLVARLHVDLQRVSSAVCRDAG